MGRAIYEDGHFIWKYMFAIQNSEQRRIVEELEVGHWYTEDVEYDDEGEPFGGDNDVVELEITDLPILEKFLADEDIERLKMTEATILYTYPGITLYGDKAQKLPQLTAEQAYGDVISYEEFDEVLEEGMYGISPSSKVNQELIAFYNRTDYPFIAMVGAFVKHMKTCHEESEQKHFVFIGEL